MIIKQAELLKLYNIDKYMTQRSILSDDSSEQLSLFSLLAEEEAGKELAHLISKQQNSGKFAVVIMMRSGLMIGEGIADILDCPVLFYDDCSDIKFMDEWNYLNQKNVYTAIICDGVINSGNSIVNFLEKTCIKRFIIVTNVISSKCKMLNIWPVYATRISDNSFVGVKQKEVSNGKGPDTSDRLFKTM